MRHFIPPHLVLILLGAMVALALLAPAAPIASSGPWRVASVAAAGVSGLTGLALLLSASTLFRRRGTNIHTFRDPDTLIVDGVYRLTRNPMYLGFALVLAGASLLLNTVWGLVLVPVFVIVTDRWYIAYEESAAARRFGDAYVAYRARVRRWI